MRRGRRGLEIRERFLRFIKVGERKWRKFGEVEAA